MSPITEPLKGNMEVKTGFGYIKDLAGNIIAKYDLVPGFHWLKENHTFVEVATKADLDAVQIFAPPKTAAIIKEEKIRAEIRKIAEDSLIRKGEL